MAKGEATREARHTMGPKEKLAIHGDVTGVTVTPIVSGSSAPPVAEPAAALPAKQAASPPQAPSTPAAPHNGTAVTPT